MYQYTTPTITITFPSDIDVSNITSMVVSFKRASTILEKELSNCAIDATENTASITLTQSETASLGVGTVVVQAHLKIGNKVYVTDQMRTTNNYTIHQEELS